MSHTTTITACSRVELKLDGLLPAYDFTNGPHIPPRFPTITSAILHHIRTIPHNIAARDNSSPGPVPREITYAELGLRSGYLAMRLRSCGVMPGNKVPLVVKRGIDMLVGIVAILRCGAQYVPLDGGVVPRATLQRVVEQCGGRVVVCLGVTVGRIAEVEMDDLKVVLVDEETADKGVESAELTDEDSSTVTESGCYVIYTSGKSDKDVLFHKQSQKTEN